MLLLLVKNISALSSADRCNFEESEKAAWDLNWTGWDISYDKTNYSGNFGYLSFFIPATIWQFFIKP